MKKSEKLELYLVSLPCALVFLSKFVHIPTLISFLILIPLATYFFPIKLFFEKSINPISFFSNFIVSSSLTLSFVSIFIDNMFFGLKLFLLIILMLNSFLLYKYNEINSYKRFLHLILLVLLPLIYFS